MKSWKPWQIVLLVYLLTLNLAVFGILGFYFLKNLFLPVPPASGTVAAALVDTPIPTPIEFTVPTSAVEAKIVVDNPEVDHIPPVNIPPALPPEEIEKTSSSLERTDTPMPSPTKTNTSQPTPTPTPTSLPTNTPQPTATATTTPSATHTATSTPSSTPTPTATATNTPRPTATPTQTSSPTPRPTATPTKTATPLPTPTSSPTSLAIVEDAVSIVASTLSGLDTNSQSKQPGQPEASLPGLIDAESLNNGKIALSWLLAKKTEQYRIYSDMGSGYGVFVYKAHTTQPSFIDEQLRSGMTYHYRLAGLEANQEVVLAQVKARTFVNEDTLTTRGSTGQPEVSTASIVAAPTALPSDAVLLGLVSDNNFIDDFNTLTIVGELRNDSNIEVGQTDISVTLYDTVGAVIGTANGETMLEAIAPGEKSPFLITLARPSGFAYYSIRAVGRPVPAAVKQGAQLSVVEVRRYEDEAGFFHIEGTIQNTGSTTAKRTKVAAVIYGRDHDVINVGFTYVNPPTLAPGEPATYEVVFAYYPRYLTQQVIPFEE